MLNILHIRPMDFRKISNQNQLIMQSDLFEARLSNKIVFFFKKKKKDREEDGQTTRKSARPRWIKSWPETNLNNPTFVERNKMKR